MTIKNADMPAIPVDRCDVDAIETGIQVFSGLTKREMMAMMAMQGILSSLTVEDDMSPKDLAKCSVADADALLAELERSKTAATQQCLRVLEGWQFVPKVPTREMIEQGNAAMAYDCCSGDASDAYQAMLAAVPKLVD